MDETKKCTKCHHDKPLSDYHKRSGGISYHSWCKLCLSTHKKAYSLKHKSEVAVRNRKSYLAKREERLETARQWRANNQEQLLIQGATERSRALNLPMDITKDDIIIPEFCPVLGIRLKNGVGRVVDSSPTLDRIEPEKGYVKGNVAVISYRANLLKGSSTLEELLKLVSYIQNHKRKLAGQKPESL